MSIVKKTVLGTALAASALAAAAPATASAQMYYHRDHGDTAGAAIAGGIVGLALGAIIASSSNHNHDRYYNNNGYYYQNNYRYQHRGYNGYYNNYDRRAYDNDDARRGYYEDRGDWRRGY